MSLEERFPTRGIHMLTQRIRKWNRKKKEEREEEQEHEEERQREQEERQKPEYMKEETSSKHTWANNMYHVYIFFLFQV